MENTKKTRSPALDIIRFFALFCVVSLHFFLYSGFYAVTISGWKLYLATLVRTLCVICVPLFILLTGYLMRHKKASKAYYKKLIRILGEYVLASLFCIAATAVSQGNGLFGIVQNVLLQIPGILSFEAAAYGWYVEMYIGLFLLIPYLNVLYNGLEGKQAKQRLIVTMLLLTGVPQILNSASFALPWTMTYNDPAGGLQVFPTWWTLFYPITYYFIGAYLSEYPLQLSKAKGILLLIASNLLTGTFCFLKSKGGLFSWGDWQDSASILIVAQAVLVFWLLLQLDSCRIGTQSKKLLALVSDLSFCAYLVSIVFDKLFYRLAGMRDGSPVENPCRFLFLIPLILLCSLAAAYVLVSIYKLLEKLIQRVTHRDV